MRIVTKAEDRLRDREIERLISDKQAMQTALEGLQRRLDIAQSEVVEERKRNYGISAERDTEFEANKVLQVNLDWFRVRLTQVEAERAKLLYLHTGVKMETPSFERSTPEDDQQRSALPDMIAGFAGFQDVGDEEARKLGIEWDDEGKIKD